MASLKGKTQDGDIYRRGMPEGLGSRGGILLRHVAPTIKGMQAAGKVAAAMESRDEFVEDVVARRPVMFREVGDEAVTRREALMVAVDAALETGLPSDAETRLRYLLPGSLFDGFRRSLSGDPPSGVEPFQVKLKVDVDLSKVKARPRIYSPSKTAWLDEKFTQLTEAVKWCTKTRKRYVQILPRQFPRAMAIAYLAISRLLINRVSRWPPRQCFWRNRRRRLLK